MADAQKLMEAIDRLVWNTVSLRLVGGGIVHASPSTRRDIERFVGESRQQLTDELSKVLPGGVRECAECATQRQRALVVGGPIVCAAHGVSLLGSTEVTPTAGSVPE